MSPKSTSVSVIGPGALGGAVIDFLRNKSLLFTLHSVWGRSAKDSYFYSTESKAQPQKDFPDKDEDLGRLILITIPDEQISVVAEKLYDEKIDWSSRTVVHMSGSLSHLELNNLRKAGAQTCSLHPLQTFSKGDAADRFSGIWFTLQGEESCNLMMQNLVTETGAHLKKMTAEQKKSMHLAAVFASNYLVSLMNVVEQITHSNNIEDGLEMLNPIILQTVENIFTRGTEQSLSGPIARGDESTVKNHLQQMGHDTDLARLYKYLGKSALTIAQKNGRITAQEFDKISDILATDENPK